MATRRPKVPRAANRPQATPEPAKEAADVIRADFGGAKGTAAAPKGAGGRQTGRHDAGREATRRSGTAATTRQRDAEGRPPPGNSRRRQHATDDGHPVPAKAFSGRMLALAVVMIAITIMLAPTVKIFFDKQAEIAALNADIAARQARAGQPAAAGLAVAGPQLREAAGPRPH